MQRSEEKKPLRPAYYRPFQATLQGSKTREQMYYEERLLQNCIASPACGETMTQLDKNPEQFQHEVDSQMLQASAHCWPNEAAFQVTDAGEQICYSEAFLKNYTASPAYWDTLTQPNENSEQFLQEAEQSTNHPHYLCNPRPVKPLKNRREKNRERERKRQQRLKEAFNVLRTVVPDYFSGRGPGDRLTRIRTLRMATQYIALLRQLLETS